MICSSFIRLSTILFLCPYQITCHSTLAALVSGNVTWITYLWSALSFLVLVRPRQIVKIPCQSLSSIALTFCGIAFPLNLDKLTVPANLNPGCRNICGTPCPMMILTLAFAELSLTLSPPNLLYLYYLSPSSHFQPLSPYTHYSIS